MRDQHPENLLDELRSLRPAVPVRGAADAAYEAGLRAGRRQASATGRRRLIVHRTATALAAAAAVALGAMLLLAHEPTRRGATLTEVRHTEASPTTDQSADPARPFPRLPRPGPPPATGSAFASPYSVASLRQALWTPSGIDLDRLPQTTGAEPPSAPPTARWRPDV